MAFLPDTALSYLQSAHTNGRLAHAYLITGPELANREQFAVRLLQSVNNSSRNSLEDFKHEGVRVIAPESKSRKITISQIRELEKTLHLGGAEAGRVKAGIILDADRMVTEAVNAFLKTLEEPPDRCLLLLLTEFPEQLLDTVRSRCIQVPLVPPPGTEATLSPQQRSLLDAVSNHFAQKPSTGTALTLMKQFARILSEIKKEIAAGYEAEAKEESAHYKQTTEGDWLKRREEHYSALGEAKYLQQRTRQLELLLLWFGDMMRTSSGSNRLDLTDYEPAIAAAAKRFAPRDLQRRYDAIESLRSNLQTNVNETLALEVAFLKAFGP